MGRKSKSQCSGRRLTYITSRHVDRNIFCGAEAGKVRSHLAVRAFDSPGPALWVGWWRLRNCAKWLPCQLYIYRHLTLRALKGPAWEVRPCRSSRYANFLHFSLNTLTLISPTVFSYESGMFATLCSTSSLLYLDIVSSRHVDGGDDVSATPQESRHCTYAILL